MVFSNYKKMHVYSKNCKKHTGKATGSCRTNALFGFHTLISCDQTGRFMGKSKTFWWKPFTNADDNILNAPGDVSKNCLLSLMYVIFF